MMFARSCVSVSAVALLTALFTPRAALSQINPANMRSGNFDGVGPVTTATLFTVPAGQTFVLTDFTWTSYPFYVAGVGTLITINNAQSNGGWSWWSFDNSVSGSPDHQNPVGAHWTTGLVYAAGLSVTLTVGAQAIPANVTWRGSWSGYLYPGTAAGVADPADRRMGFGLKPAPNPSGTQVRVDFSLPGTSEVSLAIFDVQGHKIRTLVNGELPAGAYSIPWDGNNEKGRWVADGVYIAKLVTPQGTETRKLSRRR